ncbi:HNH endonuclease signature motif containing protein [Clostridium acidisoli]|nr:HNH endonuclease signature motif containing protein [Clostridium acidisoli]
MECGEKVLEGTLCKCEQDKRKKNYKDYKIRRMKDEQERKRQRFYNSKGWIVLSESIKRHYLGLCVVCWHKGKTEESKYTHHIVELKDDMDLALVEDNLVSLCPYCHGRVHVEYDKGDKDKKKMQTILHILVKEFDDEYGL